MEDFFSRAIFSLAIGLVSGLCVIFIMGIAMG